MTIAVLPNNFIDFLRSSSLISIKEFDLEGVDSKLYTAKYKKKVFYRELWDSNLENCRGLVFTKDYEIVSLPFAKIYNYGIESNAPKFSDSQSLTAFRKINGFFVAATAYDGRILLSTTGSLNSPYTDLAYEELKLKPYITDELKSNPNYTYLFECITESDPHIIKEPVRGLICLGRRLKEFGSPVEFSQAYVDPYLWSTMLPNTNITELKRLATTVKHEGFVAYSDYDYHYHYSDSRHHKQVATKLKSTYYLVTKFLARTNQTISKQKLSKYENAEEFYGIIDHINNGIGASDFLGLDEQSRVAFVENYFVD